MAKTRFDYSLVGLSKVEGVTKFDGKGVIDLTAPAIDFLANYGLFVALTRTLAGHAKDSIKEKTDLIRKEWDWLVAGCPKRTKTVKSAYEKAVEQYDATIALIKTGYATATKTEQKTIDALIARIPKPVKLADEPEEDENE